MEKSLEMLNHYLEAWELSEPQPLAETVTSHLYTVTHKGTRLVLKLLTAMGEEEKNGAAALHYWNGRGAVRLLRDDGQAHLLEYADGEDLSALVKRGGDEEAAVIIAGVLNQLHSVSSEPLPDGLTPLNIWFRSLFKKAEADKAKGLNTIYMRAAPIAEKLLSDPRDVRVLHGDIHHENIRYRAGRGWLAFDPKGLVGERTYDAANTLCNPWDMPELVHNEVRLLKIAQILAQHMEIDRMRVLAFVYVYACLSASWSIEDGQSPEHALRVAELAEPHVRR